MTSEELGRLRQWAAAIGAATYYEILGVLEIADEGAIRHAFHEFALAFHPDVHLGAPEPVRRNVQHIFRRGAEAYRVLVDPDLRKRYDMALARGRLRLEEAAAWEPSEEHEGAGMGLKSLEDLCKTPAARLCARRADAHIGSGNLAAAQAELYQAIAHDGRDNPALEERLDALDLALFAMGE